MKINEYKYIGNYSAVDPVYSIHMTCDFCKVSWTGCWDNFQCPLCEKGELPWLIDDDLTEYFVKTEI